MNPLDPRRPIGPRRSWWVPASNARNSWRVPAVGSSLSWPDPDGPTVAWHVPTSLAARTWRVPAVTGEPRPEGTGPATPSVGDAPELAGLPELSDLPDGPGPSDHPSARSTWCASTGGPPTGGMATRAKLVAPIRSRGCVVGDDPMLADALRAWRDRALRESWDADPDLVDPTDPGAEGPEVDDVFADDLEPDVQTEPAFGPDDLLTDDIELDDRTEPAFGPSDLLTDDVEPDVQAGPTFGSNEVFADDIADDIETDDGTWEADVMPHVTATLPDGFEPLDDDREDWPDAATQRRQALQTVVRGTEHGDRQRFLAEVRRRVVGATDGTGSDPGPEPGGDPVPAPRYRDLDPTDLVGSFVHAVEAAGGRCHHVVGDLPDSLLDLLVAELDAWEIVVSGDEEVRELAERLGNRGVEVFPATPERAMAAGMGVTSAVAGIAATGALVLDSHRDKGRLAALLPPVHLCVLPVDRLVATPSEVLRSLSHAPLRLPSSLMLLTGPSRGDDVEKLLTVGALGPAALHVVLLEPRFD